MSFYRAYLPRDPNERYTGMPPPGTKITKENCRPPLVYRSPSKGPLRPRDATCARPPGRRSVRLSGDLKTQEDVNRQLGEISTSYNVPRGQIRIRLEEKLPDRTASGRYKVRSRLVPIGEIFGTAQTSPTTSPSPSPSPPAVVNAIATELVRAGNVESKEEARDVVSATVTAVSNAINAGVDPAVVADEIVATVANQTGTSPDAAESATAMVIQSSESSQSSQATAPGRKKRTRSQTLSSDISPTGEPAAARRRGSVGGTSTTSRTSGSNVVPLSVVSLTGPVTRSKSRAQTSTSSTGYDYWPDYYDEYPYY